MSSLCHLKPRWRSQWNITFLHDTYAKYTTYGSYKIATVNVGFLDVSVPYRTTGSIIDRKRTCRIHMQLRKNWGELLQDLRHFQGNS
jgi:hypothetical protein